MRILLTNHFPLTGSGSGVYTLNVANALMRQEHEVCCIFPENSTSGDTYPFKTHPVYFTDAEPIENALPFNFPCFTTHPRSVNTFENLSETEFKQYLDAFRNAIAQEVEEFKPDIIHGGHIWLISYLASEFDIPLVITAHGTDIIGFKTSTRYHDYALKAAERASAIVTISQKNAREVTDAFPFAANKTQPMPNGYDASVFYRQEVDRPALLRELGIQKDYPKLVSFAGKFTVFKRIDTLLQTAALYEDGQTATLIAGDGELFDEMCALAESLGLQDTYFLHNQPHSLLRRIYNTADVSTVPSMNEAFGLVVIEAGACGAPVLGTNDGGIADILTDKTGMLFAPGDHETLACMVKEVLSGKAQFDREEIAAYTRQRFSQDSLICKLIELYESLQNSR